MWLSSDYEKEIEIEDDEDPVVEYEYEEIVVPFSGVISYGDAGVYTELKYSQGLLRKEYSEFDNDKQRSKTTTTYNYREIFPTDTTELEIFLKKLVGDFYLTSKTTHSYTYQSGDSENTLQIIDEKGEEIISHTVKNDKKIYSSSKTGYRYSNTGANDIYLFEEWETESKNTYELQHWVTESTNSVGGTDYGIEQGWVLISSEGNIRQTFHEPLGNGWYGQSVYLNGEPQGSNISQGKPGNKVTQYTLQEVQKKLTGIKYTIKNNTPKDKDKPKNFEDEYKEWRNQLAPIIDITFPVREIAKLYELTTALKKLNRSVQEEISVDIIDNVRRCFHKRLSKV